MRPENNTKLEDDSEIREQAKRLAEQEFDCDELPTSFTNRTGSWSNEEVIELSKTKKVCTKCRAEKEVKEFTVGKVGKKGQKYYGHCKVCHAQYSKKPTKELSDKYIKEKLRERGFDQQAIEEVPQLIELKRQSIRLKRQIWQRLKNSTTSFNS